ncbi:hypothetical protein Patl1_36930 [Pistacia atlantica]|nr:hypothetical protein Patl1_36930 [Pistacia atlantica]
MSLGRKGHRSLSFFSHSDQDKWVVSSPPPIYSILCLICDHVRQKGLISRIGSRVPVSKGWASSVEVFIDRVNPVTLMWYSQRVFTTLVSSITILYSPINDLFRGNSSLLLFLSLPPSSDCLLCPIGFATNMDVMVAIGSIASLLALLVINL